MTEQLTSMSVPPPQGHQPAGQERRPPEEADPAGPAGPAGPGDSSALLAVAAAHGNLLT